MKWIGNFDVSLSDITSVIAGDGLEGGGTEGAVTLNINADYPGTLTTLSGLTSFGAAGATTNIAAGDLTMYDASGTEANPTISLGSSATNRLEIKSVYNTGTDTLCDVDFTTYTASSTNHDGRFNWYVDAIHKAVMNDGGFTSYGYINAYNDGAYMQVTDTTASSATQGGELRLRSNDEAAMENNHRLGVIGFYGAEDGSSTYSIGARIQAITRDAWDGSNNDADLEFYTTDGTSESKVLTLDADKLATFTGAVTVTEALHLDIPLATDQQKHLAYFELAGYTTADGSNFMFADIMSGNKAPFLHDDTSLGADGLTAVAPSLLLRMAGTVMPRAGVLKLWKGWGASAGDGTVSVSIFKYTPTADDDDDDALLLVKNTDFTAAGGANLKTWGETSFSVAFAAGDILITGIKGSVNNKAAYFTSTIEVEWT